MSVKGAPVKNVCIYASASDGIEGVYFKKTCELGVLLAQKGWGLVFGAGCTGLMGAVARAMLQNGSIITGVIPRKLNRRNVVFEDCHELIVTDTMRERKRIMEERSDAFIALPGGFGTMEELLEVITLKQLHYHKKPIVVMDINGYYSGLRTVFDNAVKGRFAGEDTAGLYCFTGSPEEAARYIDTGR